MNQSPKLSKLAGLITRLAFPHITYEQSKRCSLHQRHSSAWQTMPSDVLFIIARQVATVHIYPHWDTYLILRLSHVCRHWRHALISSPSLWNKISFPRNLRIADLLLDRSADYPLEISITLHYLSIPALITGKISRGCVLISAHVHRIRAVTIRAGHTSHLLPDINYQQYVDPVLSLFKKSAPMLASLSIGSVYEAQLPEMFLEDVAPNLKQLEVSYMSISYKMPIFKRVTRLCLSNVQAFASIHQLIDMLEGTSRNLKFLKLGPSIGLTSPSSRKIDIRDLNGRKIRFSHLEALDLDLQPEVMMIVLDRITTPSGLDWTISCNDALSMSDLNITPLQSFLKDGRTQRYLCINWLPRGSLIMQFAQANPGSSPPNRILRMRLPEKPEFMHRIHSLLMCFELSEVYFCEFDCKDLTGKSQYIETYHDMFGSLLLPFCQLKNLIIRCHNNEVLYQFTAQLQAVYLTFPLPCPLLDELEIGLIDNNTDNANLVKVIMDRKRTDRALKVLRVGVDGYGAEERDIRQIFENRDLAENVAVRTIWKYPVITREFDNTLTNAG